jgi:16S rRNA (cytosine967-C5)-methyltransferase
MAALKADIPKRLEALKFGLPTWLYGLMKKWYGRDEAAALAEAYLAPQPWTTLRVNRRKADSRELLNGWLEDGLEASAGLYLPEALRLKLAGNNLRDLIAWQDGLVTAQDEAAMLVSVIAKPAPEMEILDMCAAPGGKTTHLAELSDDRAAITALDLKPHRVELIKEQAERLNLRSITAIEADALTWSGDGRQFDLVLTDVPCSGLGLLGRKPELRFNMSFESIQELIKLQREILLNAAKLVKAGGLLVYSTCTINPEENERQIDWLLTDTEIGKQFSACGFEELIPGSMKLTDPEIKIQIQKGRLQLLPHKHRTDGFFISKLIRKFEE